MIPDDHMVKAWPTKEQKLEQQIRKLFSDERLYDIGSEYGIDFAMGEPSEFAIAVAILAIKELEDYEPTSKT